jgi:phosphatidylglycerol---prolipoprotein diacylglyceryl transferase
VIDLLSLLAAAAESAPIYWVDLGLRNYLFKIGSFELRWYSLAYLAGILLAYWHLSKMIKAPGAPMAQRHVDDLFFYCTLGVIIGGRLGYAAFYAPELLANPLELLQLWNGGMSFHGGLIGTVVAIAAIAWRGGLSFLRVCDYVAVCVPFGLLFGRLANFVNGELWGRVAGEGVPWAMVFPDAGPLARHPSQLYEAALEGLVLMVVLLMLFWKTAARWRPGLLVGVFTLGYGLSRFLVEYYREPDAQLLQFAERTGLSMGQWLTVPMILVGLFFVVRENTRP